MKQKGQSALEYLVTSGWVLVVLVIVIATLFAFGIFEQPPTEKNLSELPITENQQNYDPIDDVFTQENFDGNVLILRCFKMSDNPNLVCVREIFGEGEVLVLPIKGV